VGVGVRAGAEEEEAAAVARHRKEEGIEAEGRRKAGEEEARDRRDRKGADDGNLMVREVESVSGRGTSELESKGGWSRSSKGRIASKRLWTTSQRIGYLHGSLTFSADSYSLSFSLSRYKIEIEGYVALFFTLHSLSLAFVSRNVQRDKLSLSSNPFLILHPHLVSSAATSKSVCLCCPPSVSRPTSVPSSSSRSSPSAFSSPGPSSSILPPLRAKKSGCPRATSESHPICARPSLPSATHLRSRHQQQSSSLGLHLLLLSSASLERPTAPLPPLAYFLHQRLSLLL
jgi:hypothetical protein